MVETALSGLPPMRRMVYLEWGHCWTRTALFAVEQQAVVLYLNGTYLNSFNRG